MPFIVHTYFFFFCAAAAVPFFLFPQLDLVFSHFDLFAWIICNKFAMTTDIYTILMGFKLDIWNVKKNRIMMTQIALEHIIFNCIGNAISDQRICRKYRAQEPLWIAQCPIVDACSASVSKYLQQSCQNAGRIETNSGTIRGKRKAEHMFFVEFHYEWAMRSSLFRMIRLSSCHRTILTYSPKTEQ